MLSLVRRLARWCRFLCQLLLLWIHPRPRLFWPTPRTGGPARRPHAPPKPRWVRDELIRLKALMPEAGCRMIAHCFNRRWAVRRHMTVGKTYVADTLRRQQYTILCLRRKLKHRVPRPIQRNRIWGCDVLAKADQRGHQHLALAIVDHASRACLRLQCLPDKSSLRLLQELVQAVKRYGCPQFLRTDNETVFTSAWFTWGVRLLGIRHQRTDPGCPWQNGRVERFIGTVKRALDAEPSANKDAFSDALRAVRSWYNHDRPHDHLQGRTPAEVWAGSDVFAPRSRAGMGTPRTDRRQDTG